MYVASKFTKTKTNMTARGLLRKTLFPPSFGELFPLSVIFNIENIHPSGNFKGKHPFKPLC